MEIQTKKISSVKITLEIPSNPEKILSNGYNQIGEFHRKFLSSLIAMTNDDNYFTYYEYEKLFIIIDEIFEKFVPNNDLNNENVIFDKVLIYNYAYDRIIAKNIWNEELKELEIYIEKEFKIIDSIDDKEKFQKILSIFFEIIIPLIEEQNNAKIKLQNWGKVLKIKDDDINKHLLKIDEFENKKNMSFLSIKSFTKYIPFNDSEKKAKNNFEANNFFLSLASSFELTDFEQKLRCETDLNKLEIYKEIKKSVLKIAKDNIPDDKELATLSNLSDKYIKIIIPFVEQAKKRLNIIPERLDFQLSVFESDYKNFKDYSLARLYKTLSQGMTENDIKYGEYSELIRSKYDNLLHRHKEFINLWKKEMDAFEVELEELSKNINTDIFEKERIKIEDISKRVRMNHTMLSFKKKVKSISSRISNLADIGVVAGGTAAFGGILSIGVITSIVANPIGIAITVGVISIITAAKFLSNKINIEKSKENSIDRNVNDFESKFESVFPFPQKEYNELLNNIYINFINCSKKYYEPLFLKVVLLSSEINHKKIIFNSMLSETEKAIDEQIMKYQE